jgi:hypothetical protein
MVKLEKYVVCLALAVFAASAAFAQAGKPSKAELHSKLLPIYETVRQNTALLAADRTLDIKNPAAVDAFLKQLPISPLDYLQIDMEVRRYEVFVARHIAEYHVRWIELHDKEARELYGDAYVDQLLAAWPVDTGADAVGTGDELSATVGTNRNSASTFTPAPLDYQGEIQIAVNHRNVNQMVSAANTWDGAGGICSGNDTQAVFYSSNGGTSWGYTCSPSSSGYGLGTCSGTVFGSDPALYWNDNNEVFLNYMMICSMAVSTDYAMVVARSADGGATWTPQGVIRNGWPANTLEDKNFYAIDNTPTSPFYGRHYTCWDRSNNEKMAYSSNNGATWTEVDLPTAPVGGIDLACELAVQKNGTVHVVWDSLTCGANCTDERMWYSRSANGGVSWSAAIQVRDFNLVGFSGANTPPVADNRGINPFGAIDVDNSGGACDGTLYATFSDWTSGGATQNDVWLTRSTNGGTTWSTAIKVNDDNLANRTQFHPFLQVDQSNGHVIVGWHDARNDANNRRVDYYVARSTDCGLTFEANIQASQPSAEFNNSGISYTDENTTDNPNRNPNQYGEYLGLDVKNGKAYMAWTDSRHFYPGSSTNTQKENVGFAVIDFGPVVVPVCGDNLREGSEVCDGTDLSGQTCASQGFSGGGTLSCNGTCSAFVTSACIAGSTTTTFTSVATQDGRVIESGENTNVGGTVNSNATTTSAIRIGDTNQDRQQKGFVSFDTSAIPDGATVQTVTLRLRRGSLTGTNPFTTHGSMSADVSPAFGGSTTLATGDFQAAASAGGVCTLTNAAANLDWSECTFNAAGLAAINKTGTTQVRVQFSLDDNDDTGNDYLGYYSGDNGTAANRPQLVVTYQ